jgi:hypothetical protein
VNGKCEKSEKYMKDVKKEDYDKCVQDYPNCGETVLERSNKVNETDRAKKTNGGRRRSKTKKGGMRRKRMTKRR